MRVSRFLARDSSVTASDGKPNDFFGTSIAIEDGCLVAGAPQDLYTDSTDGSAYVFRFDGTSWTQRLKLQAIGYGNHGFGRVISLSNSRAMVGQPNFDDFLGSVYVIPVPRAQSGSYGDGWPGTSGVPELDCVGPPLLGGTIALHIGNSLGAPTIGVLLIGSESASIHTNLGGTLLVGPSQIIYPLAIPAAGFSATLALPSDCQLLEQIAYAQALEVDPGASHGVAFTSGLSVAIGYP